MNTRAIGIVGENIAAEYLKTNGYKILERNFSCRVGEVDIIAQHAGYYVFIEVKNRNSVEFGRPCDAVTPYKQQKIISVAKYWLLKNHKTTSPIRFDVVEIINGKASLIADAFRL